MPPPFPDIDARSADSWSLRILWLSVGGVLFLTLFPFRFAMPVDHSPVLLTGMGKTGTAVDVILNVLLMFPLGFGLAEYLDEHGKSRKTILFASLAAGILFSYAVETLQIYVPTRDSGWSDVITNSSGCVLGAVAYGAAGSWILRIASRIESALAGFLSPRAVALVFCVYFGIWLTVSFQLQKKSRLANWNLDSVLLVNDNPGVRLPDASGKQVLRLEFWDQTLPDPVAASLSAGSAAGAAAKPITAYDFTSRLPVRDQAGLLPPVTGQPSSAVPYDSMDPDFAGERWPGSEVSAADLSDAIQRSNHFSVWLMYRPESVSGPPSRILWLGTSDGPANLWLRQDGNSLIVSLRTPLSARHAQLAWAIPGVFAQGETRNIVLTYDGASLSFFLNGRKSSRLYRLGPGAALAQIFRWLRPPELEAYSDIYYAVVFFPAGALLGFAWRNLTRGNSHQRLALVVLYAAPPLILEIALMDAASRRLQWGRLALSYALLAAGALWINGDRAQRRPENECT